MSDHFPVYEGHIFLMHSGPYEVFINMCYIYFRVHLDQLVRTDHLDLQERE